MGQTWNVLSSWRIHCMVHNYFFKIYDFPMSLVCCPLTKPGVTLAGVRFLHWNDGDDDTHFYLTLPSVGRLRSTFFGIQSALHIQKSCPMLAIVVRKDSFVFCIKDWLVQKSIVGKLTWNIGCKPEDGMVTHCVGHYDICPGVCLNLTDGSC